MIRSPLSRTLIVAGLFAAAGAVQAQQAAETSNTPQRAGEASTMTQGAPNAKTTNATTTDKTTAKSKSKAGKSMDASASGSTGKGSATETSNVPQRAGEASTMTGGAPNKKTTN